MKQHTTLIINTQSRHGQVIHQELPAILKQQHIQVDSIRSVTSGQMPDLLRQLRKDPPAHILIAGGDGTISSIINAVNGHSVTLGIIPAGTTNNIARSLGLPLTPAEAVEVIATGRAQPVNIGQINGQSFVNVATIGLSAVAAEHVGSQEKKLLGRLAYMYEGAKYFFKHEHFRCRLELDGQIQTFYTHQIIVANGAYHGGFPLAPDAAITRPDFFVTALAVNQNRAQHALSLLKLALGQTKKDAHTVSAFAKRLKIETSPIQPIEADGELITHTPASIHIHPQTIRIKV